MLALAPRSLDTAGGRVMPAEEAAFRAGQADVAEQTLTTVRRTLTTDPELTTRRN